MGYLEITFDDNRCRNIFVSLLNSHLPGTEVFHKSHTSYQKIYIQAGVQDISPLQEEYQQRREKFLKEISQLLSVSIQSFLNQSGGPEDFSGEEYVKINFPSPYSFMFLRAVLNSKGVKITEGPTASTAIINIWDVEEFTTYWKGTLKPIVGRLEKKISAIATKYLEEQ